MMLVVRRRQLLQEDDDEGWDVVVESSWWPRAQTALVAGDWFRGRGGEPGGEGEAKSLWGIEITAPSSSPKKEGVSGVFSLLGVVESFW